MAIPPTDDFILLTESFPHKSLLKIIKNHQNSYKFEPYDETLEQHLTWEQIPKTGSSLLSSSTSFFSKPFQVENQINPVLTVNHAPYKTRVIIRDIIKLSHDMKVIGLCPKDMFMENIVVLHGEIKFRNLSFSNLTPESEKTNLREIATIIRAIYDTNFLPDDMVQLVTLLESEVPMRTSLIPFHLALLSPTERLSFIFASYNNLDYLQYSVDLSLYTFYEDALNSVLPHLWCNLFQDEKGSGPVQSLYNYVSEKNLSPYTDTDQSNFVNARSLLRFARNLVVHLKERYPKKHLIKRHFTETHSFDEYEIDSTIMSLFYAPLVKIQEAFFDKGILEYFMIGCTIPKVYKYVDPP